MAFDQTHAHREARHYKFTTHTHTTTIEPGVDPSPPQKGSPEAEISPPVHTADHPFQYRPKETLSTSDHQSLNYQEPYTKLTLEHLLFSCDSKFTLRNNWSRKHLAVPHQRTRTGDKFKFKFKFNFNLNLNHKTAQFK